MARESLPEDDRSTLRAACAGTISAESAIKVLRFILAWDLFTCFLIGSSPDVLAIKKGVSQPMRDVRFGGENKLRQG